MVVFCWISQASTGGFDKLHPFFLWNRRVGFWRKKMPHSFSINQICFFSSCHLQYLQRITLPETNIFAPENGWLEHYIVSFWDGLFSGAMLVSGSVSLKEKVQRDSDDRGICLGWSTNRLRFALPTHLLGNAPPRMPEMKFQFIHQKLNGTLPMIP